MGEHYSPCPIYFRQTSVSPPNCHMQEGPEIHSLNFLCNLMTSVNIDYLWQSNWLESLFQKINNRAECMLWRILREWERRGNESFIPSVRPLQAADNGCLWRAMSILELQEKSRYILLTIGLMLQYHGIWCPQFD